jgi:hypothetical protein
VIDFDALVAPIEMAQSHAEARSAVWAALRQVKASMDCASADEKLDTLSVIDACAWTAGVSVAFRGTALAQAATNLGVRYVRIPPSIPSASLDLDSIAADPWSVTA